MKIPSLILLLQIINAFYNIKYIPLYYKMNQKTMMVMLFYAVLTFLAGPMVGERFLGKDGVGYGMIVGAVVSIGLWYTVGQKFVK